MDDKKEFILKRVGNLYLKYGIRSVTMDDVARELAISKKTLYLFFKDKKDLVSSAIDYYLEKPQFKFSMTDEGNAIDDFFALRNHVVEIMKHYNNNLEYDLKRQFPRLYEKVRDAKRIRIYESTVINIQKGIRQGLYRGGLDAELIAKIQVGRMLCTMNPDMGIFNENEASSLEVFDKLIEYHMHGICNEKGLEYYHEQLNSIKNEKEN